jgi:hypothetical protein
MFFHICNVFDHKAELVFLVPFILTATQYSTLLLLASNFSRELRAEVQAEYRPWAF